MPRRWRRRRPSSEAPSAGHAAPALVNLVDHGLSLQQAVEAPRLWTQGDQLEVEPGFSDAVVDALRACGHDVQRVANVGGGMCAVGFEPDGMLEGAASALSEAALGSRDGRSCLSELMYIH